MEAGSEVRVARQPQPWLNRRREVAYDVVAKTLRGQIESGNTTPYAAFKALLPSLATTWRQRLDASLTAEDRGGFALRVVRSPHLSEVAGYPIVRPVFVVSDDKVYRKVDAVLRTSPAPRILWPDEQQEARQQSNTGIHAHGRAIPIDLPGADISGLDMVIARDNPDTIEHETRHTVDPQKRTGYDRILEEMFAYYEQHVIKRNDWNGFSTAVMARGYYEQYSRGRTPGSRITFHDWTIRASLAGHVLQDLQARIGDIAAERVLAQSRTYEDFLLRARTTSR